MTEQEVKEWLEAQDVLLRRAIEEIEKRVKAFIVDWAGVWGFRYEEIEKVRIKDAPRLLAKADRKGLTKSDQLLTRREEGGRMRFPVQDLLGVRVLVLSLNDVVRLKKGVEGLLEGNEQLLYPLGNAEDARVEDINENPRPKGYRALHIDGSVTVRVREADRGVPFEVQVKTLAQHVFGQHTHDEAYVPDDGNDDPRYEHIRGLQESLAESLNGADLLLARTEEMAGMVRDDILRRAAGEGLSPASVANAVREQFGVTIREHEALRWTEQGLRVGITESAAFAALIDPTGDKAADLAEQFRHEHDRAPAYGELIDELLESPGLSEDEKERNAEVEARIDEPTPPNPLDEFDPDVDVNVPGS
ncbi:MAG: pyrophosphokinae [Solirubrobacterales bacterium]|jgi:ppGpp synthetase/RelA/SpoT-type nucleotidyltranferase|nr:pyrophosphokinae [Solirubrobacterales bacterium]